MKVVLSSKIILTCFTILFILAKSNASTRTHVVKPFNAIPEIDRIRESSEFESFHERQFEPIDDTYSRIRECILDGASGLERLLHLERYFNYDLYALTERSQFYMEALCLAIINEESKFDEFNFSSDGVGLMGIDIEKWCRGTNYIAEKVGQRPPLSFAMMLDGPTNCSVGIAYLLSLYDEITAQKPSRGDPLKLTLLAYAIGAETAFSEETNIPSEACNYVERIMANYEKATTHYKNTTERYEWKSLFHPYPRCDLLNVKHDTNFCQTKDVFDAIQFMEQSVDQRILEWMQENKYESLIPVVDYRVKFDASEPFFVFCEGERAFQLTTHGVENYKGTDGSEICEQLQRYGIEGVTGPERGMICFVPTKSYFFRKNVYKEWEPHLLPYQVRRYCQFDQETPLERETNTLCLIWSKCYVPATKPQKSGTYPAVKTWTPHPLALLGDPRDKGLAMIYLPAYRNYNHRLDLFPFGDPRENFLATMAWQAYGALSQMQTDHGMRNHGAVKEFILPLYTVVESLFGGKVSEIAFTPLGYELSIKSEIDGHVLEQIFGALGAVRRDIRGKKIDEDTKFGYVSTSGLHEKIHRFLFVLKLDGKQIDFDKNISLPGVDPTIISKLDQARLQISSNLAKYKQTQTLIPKTSKPSSLGKKKGDILLFSLLNLSRELKN